VRGGGTWAWDDVARRYGRAICAVRAGVAFLPGTTSVYFEQTRASEGVTKKNSAISKLYLYALYIYDAIPVARYFHRASNNNNATATALLLPLLGGNLNQQYHVARPSAVIYTSIYDVCLYLYL